MDFYVPASLMWIGLMTAAIMTAWVVIQGLKAAGRWLFGKPRE